MEKIELSTVTGDRMKTDMPSTNNLLETKEAKESGGPLTQPAFNYPSGITLSLVVTALMLAMFLVALDMVICPELY